MLKKSSSLIPAGLVLAYISVNALFPPAEMQFFCFSVLNNSLPPEADGTESDMCMTSQPAFCFCSFCRVIIWVWNAPHEAIGSMLMLYIVNVGSLIAHWTFTDFLFFFSFIFQFPFPSLFLFDQFSVLFPFLFFSLFFLFVFLASFQIFSEVMYSYIHDQPHLKSTMTVPW